MTDRQRMREEERDRKRKTNSKNEETHRKNVRQDEEDMQAGKAIDRQN